ncbi:hypothetical protein PG997_014582 [Apiospora hydei]|uniref:Protein fem-1 homolog B n=1 Tax=Apiospora hydei TaxID=1337664 RepID=A0ABR1UU74_9PEZI
MAMAPSKVANDEVTAASTACNEQSNWDTSAFEKLLEKNWDINSYLGYSGDALSLAVGANKLPLVKYLLDHGADPNRNLRGDTHSAIELAAIVNAQLGIFTALVDHGAKVKGRSVMLIAARTGRVDVLEHLHRKVDGPSLINAVPNNDNVYDNAREQTDFGTPLHGAAGNGQTETVEWLLKQGASSNIKNDSGLTPKEVAAKEGHVECEKLL